MAIWTREDRVQSNHLFDCFFQRQAAPLFFNVDTVKKMSRRNGFQHLARRLVKVDVLFLFFFFACYPRNAIIISTLVSSSFPFFSQLFGVGGAQGAMWKGARFSLLFGRECLSEKGICVAL